MDQESKKISLYKINMWKSSQQWFIIQILKKVNTAERHRKKYRLTDRSGYYYGLSKKMQFWQLEPLLGPSEGHVCDEWGGAESRGNGARPVE